jgi:nucleoid DNA-binding protein
MKLTKLLSKKTGISRKDLDGLLKVIGYEIIEELRTYHRFEFPNLGIIFCSPKDGRLYVKISITQESFERLNKIEKGERKDEIIFD